MERKMKYEEPNMTIITLLEKHVKTTFIGGSDIGDGDIVPYNGVSNINIEGE